METAIIVAEQTCVMLIYMLIGALMFRFKKISEQGSKDLATLLVWLIIPVVILNSFCVPYSTQRLLELGISTLLGAAALGISIGIAALLLKRNPIENFAAAFSNAGFIGIPLVQAAFGSDAVFFLVGLAAIMGVLQWTYGNAVLTGQKGGLTLKGILLNPIMVGALIGLILFLTGLGDALPSVLQNVFSGISSINAPIAMFVLGTYLAQVDLKKMFLNGRTYLVAFIRLLLIPLLTAAVFALLPVSSEIKLTILMAASAPVGANVAVYAQLNGMDHGYAGQQVVLSTMLSVVTLPLVLLIAEMLPG